METKNTTTLSSQIWEISSKASELKITTWNDVSHILQWEKKTYWSVTDLEPSGILNTQESWDTFKKSSLYSKFETPDIVKGVLISRKIIP